MEDAVFIISNLEEHSSSSSHVSVDEILEDEKLEIPDEASEGDLLLEPQMKYSSAGAAVIVFGSPAGTEFVGNKALIDMNLPDYFPSLY